MRWRSEPISVEKLPDELWVGVKGQSSWEIARTPRNAFRGSVERNGTAGRATDWARGLHRLPNPDELRMAVRSSAVRRGVLRSRAERERTQTIS
jgi:hypothetical protein